MYNFMIIPKPTNSSILSQCLQLNGRLIIRKTHNDTKKKYTDTVLLPRSTFPARLSGKKRVEMDAFLHKKCGFSELYSWQRNNLSDPEFILHDGPPYANGVLHMGHAINKILKDITLRHKIMRGQKVHYIPGWDCHGLPIELKALNNLKTDIKNLSPLEIRNRARKYADEAILQQMEGFSSWGILADWNKSNCYFTNQPSYMINQLQQFIKLYEKGLLFRDFKPVYWSPSTRTALAEAELKYNEKHESKCVTVRLKLLDLPTRLNALEDRMIYALTWTTTPWTLVANQALAYSSESTYSIVEDTTGNLYILAEDLVANNEQKIGQVKHIMSIKGDELNGATYAHPITKETLPFLPADHVTTKMGTGLVHTAPAHGPEDFLVGLENKIPVLSMVDEEGKYTELAGKEFHGLEVLYEGTDKVLQHLASDILHHEVMVHSYPYDWRTNKPVIIRASHQWFIDINSIKEKTIECLKQVKIYPEMRRVSFENAFLNQIKNRPYWCISRQRCWGTPIPVFYHKNTKQMFITRKFINRLSDLIKQYGSDCWWELPNEKLVGKEICEEWNVKIDDLEKGEDIMDIWFDSGISWSAVLPEERKADLYLEGVDQIRGWFQSSLLTSVALQERSPYKTLFVHGFAVDENNLKMSKSEGNVINPDDIIRGKKDLKKHPAYGIDTLRWWVSGHGCQHSQVPVTQDLLNSSLDSINKLRLVLRFLLGSLYPYLDSRTTIEPNYLHIDKYMLHRIFHYNNQIQDLYETYQYHHVHKTIVNFVANDVSSIYCHLVKDRLYCEDKESPYRVAVTKVINQVLTVLARTIAPIMPHLAEEVWLNHPENFDHVPLHQTTHTVSESWNQPRIEELFNTALNLRLEVCKEAKINTWELAVTVKSPESDYNLLSNLQTEEQSSTSELTDILQVSSVRLLKHDVAETKIELQPIDRALCGRCRRYPETQTDGLCERCFKILNPKVRAAIV